MRLSRVSRNSIRTLLAAIVATCSAAVGNEPWLEFHDAVVHVEPDGH